MPASLLLFGTKQSRPCSTTTATIHARKDLNCTTRVETGSGGGGCFDSWYAWYPFFVLHTIFVTAALPVFSFDDDEDISSSCSCSSRMTSNTGRHCCGSSGVPLLRLVVVRVPASIVLLLLLLVLFLLCIMVIQHSSRYPSTSNGNELIAPPVIEDNRIRSSASMG